MLDMKLIRAIRHDHYDAWMKPDDAGHVEPFADDPELRYVKADDWKAVLSWTIGTLNEPSVLVRFQYRRIRTGWGFTDQSDLSSGFPVRYPAEEFVTPVFVVSGVQESENDYLSEVAELRKRSDIGKFRNTTLIYDATACGVTVERQLWTLNGFERIVPLRIIGNEPLKESNTYSVVGRSAVIHDLKHIFEQSRIRIPDDKRFDKLVRQLGNMKAERTPQGYYKTIDERTNEGIVNQLMTLAIGLSFTETECSAGEFAWWS